MIVLAPFTSTQDLSSEKPSNNTPLMGVESHNVALKEEARLQHDSPARRDVLPHPAYIDTIPLWISHPGDKRSTSEEIHYCMSKSNPPHAAGCNRPIENVRKDARQSQMARTDKSTGALGENLRTNKTEKQCRRIRMRSRTVNPRHSTFIVCSTQIWIRIGGWAHASAEGEKQTW